MATPRFDRRMSDAEGLMWRLDKDWKASRSDFPWTRRQRGKVGSIPPPCHGWRLAGPPTGIRRYLYNVVRH